MLPSLNQKLKLTFESSFQFQSRVKKGLFRDQIYMGMFADTLIKKGYSKGVLHLAVKHDILEKKYSQPNDINGSGGYRAGYLYKGKRIDKNKVLQTVKRLWKKIKK